MFNKFVIKLVSIFALVIILLSTTPSLAKSVEFKVDFQQFLARHDLVWDQLPQRWETSPFLGNGAIGFMVYQDPKSPNNVLRVDFGRGDYYDHRPVSRDRRDSWVNVGRLPSGHFEVQSQGKVAKFDLRLSLWDAQLTGQIETSEGSYHFSGLVDSNSDVMMLDISAITNEQVTITWHPAQPYSSARTIATRIYTKAQQAEAKYSPLFKHLAELDYPAAPPVVLAKEQQINTAFQDLLNHQGQMTVAWSIKRAPAAVRLLASIHHSYPEQNSREIAINNIKEAQQLLSKNQLVAAHQQWWHEYYQKSFLTLSDKRVEGFYWIQMYKFAAATRGDSSILDLMGPWYQKTIWPLIWADLNVQLTYWTTLTANRLDVAASLPNNIDKYRDNLHQNVASDWQHDSTSIGTIFPPNMLSPANKQVSDILLWVLHNYWLYCQYAGDDARLRDDFFPLLKTTVNTYLHYFEENKLDLGDGKLHIKKSWSPEYPGGHGIDTNFSLSLLTWATQTLLELDQQHQLNDSKRGKWQDILDNLADYPVDNNGLRISRDIAFTKSHRHYSHLLGLYPLYVFDPFDKDDKQLLSTTLDHWLAVAQDSSKKADSAMAVTGYTATGAASMYASLHQPQKAYQYLINLLDHQRISSTTMYSEGSPVIESPLSFATSVHDMVLQSWGGKIQVFPAIPTQWSDLEFYHLRTQGAFLVSAKKTNGITQFVEVESLVGTPLVIKTDVSQPHYFIDDVEVTAVVEPHGFVTVELAKGQKLQIISQTFIGQQQTINSVVEPTQPSNIYGLNKRSTIMPGYHYYLNPKAK